MLNLHFTYLLNLLLEPVMWCCVTSDIPRITCDSHQVSADMGDPVTLSCEVRASPDADVTWYFGTGNETLDSSTDADSWTVATEVRAVLILNSL